jgi:hypothetical protein
MPSGALCRCRWVHLGRATTAAGKIPEHPQAFYQTVTATSHPSTVENWLNCVADVVPHLDVPRVTINLLIWGFRAGWR